MSTLVGLIGDLHLTKRRIHNLVNNAVELMFNHLDSILTTMLDIGVKKVVILGDISDKDYFSEKLIDDIEFELMLFLNKWDDKFEIHIILGNHDLKNKKEHSLKKIEWLSKVLWQNIHVHTKYKKLKWGSQVIEMLPFPLKHGKVKGSICFAHTDRAGALSDTGFKLKDGVEVNDDSTYYMGHLHVKQDIGKTHFPGTPYQCSFGEPVEKGYGILNISKKVKYTWVKLDKLPWRFNNLEITKLDELKTISRDLSYLYKVFHPKTLVLPPDTMMKYPNIIELIAYGKEGALKHQIESESIDYDITTNLDIFLKNKGFRKKQIKRALSLVKKAQKGI